MKPLNITPLKEQPRYAQAFDRFNELCQANAKVEGRILEIEVLLSEGAPSDPKSAHVDAALDFVATGVVRGPGNIPAALRDEHLVLREQRDALKTFIETHRDGLKRIADELSGEVCGTLDAEHRKLAARMLTNLAEMDALLEEDKAFVRGIEQAGYSPRLRDNLSWWAVGAASDQSGSLMWHRMRELKFASVV